MVTVGKYKTIKAAEKAAGKLRRAGFRDYRGDVRNGYFLLMVARSQAKAARGILKG